MYFSEKNVIKKYDLTTNTVATFYTRPPDINMYNGRFSIDEHTLYLYTQLNEDTKEAKEEIRTVDLDSKAEKSWGAFKVSIYSGYEHLFQVNGVDILREQGGDGCGGYGSIYRGFSNPTKILDIGAGCSNKPRYTGYVGSSLILTSVPSEVKEPENIPLEKLYKKDALTDAEETLFDISTLPDKPTYAVMSTNKKYIVFVGHSTLYLFDLDSRSIVKQFANDVAKVAYTWKMIDTTLYGYDNEKFYVVDIINGNVQALSYTVIPSSTVNPAFIGVWQGKPLVSLETIQN